MGRKKSENVKANYLNLRIVVFSTAVVLASFITYIILRPDCNIAVLDEATFRQFDANGDNKFDKEEFLNLIPYIDQKCCQSWSITPFSKVNDEGVIVLQSTFTPLDLDNIENKNYESHLFKTDPKYIMGLLKWTTPNKRLSFLRSSAARLFLPPSSHVSIGDSWCLYSPLEHTPPRNIHDPPATTGIEKVLQDCLSTFHPRPFLQTRFRSRGGYAYLRARRGSVLDIYFRFHAEFQLNDPSVLPFWYTPGQFTGNIIINRESGKVHYFHLYVPTDKELNVDMEWFASDDIKDSLHVEIGYMPRMEMVSVLHEKDRQSTDFEWIEESTEAEAMEALEKEFYPFKQVKYYTFQDAFDKSAAEKKLVHNIVLWGALDDQSC